ncbi:MAG: sodium:solute symporter [Chitinophagia bacterium]|nr:sodium:solute symporter [Chitinophagia bacterium]
MSITDWLVMLATLALMVVYGLLKSRQQCGADTYLKAGGAVPWYTVLLGIMATQASAITFLSAPGQAYTDGMRFLQYYFGLPVAMIVVSAALIPVYRKWNVFTAYQYLEQRFDRRTRLLCALLFLLSRGLSTGISIYAPAIILSSILGVNIYVSNILTGGLLLVYTYAGGAKAVAHTQKLQFVIILGVMALAGVLALQQLPHGVGLPEALLVAGKAGRLNVITTAFSWKDKYNIWSGLIGGFFLALSYFGTDQSQVGRYIGARSSDEGRLGLLLNGIVKIPMQFAILLLGVLVFAFYHYHSPPVSFNAAAWQRLATTHPEVTQPLERQHQQVVAHRSLLARELVSAGTSNTANALSDSLRATEAQVNTLRAAAGRLLNQYKESPDANDTNYIFLYFVKSQLPVGIVGLVFAVIILASWGSISAALNALAASSLMDLHLDGRKTYTDSAQLALGRWHTLAWGLFCIAVAMFTAKLGSLIEAVNVLGSLFYGTILGIFLVAIYVKRVNGRAVFAAACITEVVVIAINMADILSFLWLNAIGALLVVVLGWLFSWLKPLNKPVSL